MARELDITIKVDGAEEAQRKLGGVDKAIDGVESSAKTAGGALGKIDAELKALGPSFDTAINKATSYTQKITQIGGATKLSADEQKKATEVLKAGIAEYDRLGKTVPAAVQAVSRELAGLSTATQAVTAETTAAAGSVSKLGGLTTLLGGATLVAGAAFVAAVPMALKYASSLDQIAKSSGAGVEGAQRLENIAVRTSTQVGNLAQGTSELARRIADGDKSALSAMDRLGITTSNFLSLRADDKFIQVASALGRVADSGERANLAKDLFSNWQEVLPALTTDVGAFADSIHTMSAAQVEDLVKVQREWDALKLSVKRTITEIVALVGTPIVVTVKVVWEGLGNVARFAANPASFLTNPFVEQAEADAKANLDVWNAGFGVENASDRAKVDAASFVGSNDSLNDVLKEIADLRTVREREAAKWQEVLANAQFAREISAMGGKAAPSFSADFIGPQEAPVYSDAGIMLGDPSKLFNRTITGQRFGSRTYANGNFTGMDMSGPVGIKDAARANITAASGGGHSFSDDIASAVPNAIQAAIQGGGSKLQAAGSALGGILFGKDSGLTKTITGGITKLFGADGVLGKTLSSAVPIIGSLIGPAIEGLGKLWGKVFGTAGRDAVREFAAGIGGFDEVHKKLNALGADGEVLWKQLTQGVGRNNAEQAKAAIEAVTKAFEKFEKELTIANSTLTTTASKLEHVTAITPDVRDGLAAALNAKTPAEFAAALTTVNGLLDAQAQKHQHLKDLADKYGISLKDMGKNFAQGEVDAKAQVLLTDFADLTAAGVDATAILKGMAGQYSELVQVAKDTGTEIPLSMKPTLQKLIDMGELVDKDGKKLTDLDGLNFGDTLELRLKDIKDVVKDLQHAIEDLAGAFRGLPSSLPSVPTVNTSPRGEVPPPNDSTPEYGYDGGTIDDPGLYTSHTGAIIRAAGLERFHTGGALLRATRQLGLANDERLIIGQTEEGVLNRGAMGNMSAQQFHALNRGVDPAAVFGAAHRGGVVGPSVNTAKLEQSVNATLAELQAIRSALQQPPGDTVVQMDGDTLMRVQQKRWQNNTNQARTRTRDALQIS